MQNLHHLLLLSITSSFDLKHFPNEWCIALIDDFFFISNLGLISLFFPSGQSMCVVFASYCFSIFKVINKENPSCISKTLAMKFLVDAIDSLFFAEETRAFTHCFDYRFDSGIKW